jgi:hypothetical protein
MMKRSRHRDAMVDIGSRKFDYPVNAYEYIYKNRKICNQKHPFSTTELLKFTFIQDSV